MQLESGSLRNNWQNFGEKWEVQLLAEPFCTVLDDRGREEAEEEVGGGWILYYAETGRCLRSDCRSGSASL